MPIMLFQNQMNLRDFQQNPTKQNTNNLINDYTNVFFS